MLPGGLGEFLYRARDRLLRMVARRRGIVVAGLSDTPRIPPALVPLRSAPPERVPSRPAGEDPPVGQAALAVSGLDAAYSGVQVLFGVDLTVRRGEILALLGTNGSGKSTLLRAVSGIIEPSAGRITFEGNRIDGHGPTEIARLGIGHVPGGRGVFPTLTVAENLRIAGWLRRRDPSLAPATERALELFPVLRQRQETNAGLLSGGEQQMLSLAQALLAEPRLLLIDELSLGLAPAVVDQLLDAVRTIAEGGTAVVVVEQRVPVALRVAERAVFLEKGAVTYAGPTGDLLARPDIVHSVYLGRPRPTVRLGEAPPPERPVHPAPEPALTTSGLSKRYGGVTAVDGITLTVDPGEIVGLVGPNGSGKTTFFDLICGLTRPDAGRVALNGIDVSTWPAHTRAGLALGRSFQDARLWPSLTVEHVLAVARERHHQARAALPAMLGLPTSTEAEADVRAHA